MAKMSKTTARLLATKINSLLVWSATASETARKSLVETDAETLIALDKKIKQEFKWFNDAAREIEELCGGDMTINKYCKWSGEEF